MSASPRVTLAMYTFQQARFVAAAVEGALAQDWPNLEVLISDDASPDGTGAVIEDTVAGYNGPHDVLVRVRKTRLGGRWHLPTLAREASGEVVIIAHGDDISLPHRVSTLMALRQKTGAAWLASNAYQFGADGRISAVPLYSSHPSERVVELETLVQTGWQDHMLGAVGAFDRELLTHPDFIPLAGIDVCGGWDHLIPFRAALRSRLAWTPEPLVLYRRHAAQNSHVLADRSKSEDAWREQLHAHQLYLESWLTEELEHALRREEAPARRARLERVRDLHHAALRKKLAEWRHARTGARMAYLKEVWLTPQERRQVLKNRLTDAS